ncbi:MAG TPA: hypothetical protein DDY28_02805 [Hyphomonas atlantica]|nr:hypothetical protein [Hyphomonas atlantica]
MCGFEPTVRVYQLFHLLIFSLKGPISLAICVWMAIPAGWVFWYNFREPLSKWSFAEHWGDSVPGLAPINPEKWNTLKM